jgi:hypothetical protein
MAQQYILHYLTTSGIGAGNGAAIDGVLRDAIMEIFRYHYTTTATSKLAYVPWHRILEHVFFHRVLGTEHVSTTRCALPREDCITKLGMDPHARRDPVMYSLGEVYKVWAAQAAQRTRDQQHIITTTPRSLSLSLSLSPPSTPDATRTPLSPGADTPLTRRALELARAKQSKKREKLQELLAGIEQETQKWRHQRLELDSGIKKALSFPQHERHPHLNAFLPPSSTPTPLQHPFRKTSEEYPAPDSHSFMDVVVMGSGGLADVDMDQLDNEGEDDYDASSPSTTDPLERARRLQAKKRSQQSQLALLLSKARKLE